MTVEEYRAALERLSDTQFQQFRERWGGAETTVDACVQTFAYAKDPVQWERIIVFHLRRFGLDLKTEDDKRLAAAEDSARAALTSSVAAGDSAAAAFRSARWSMASFIVALLALVASIIVALFGRQ